MLQNTVELHNAESLTRQKSQRKKKCSPNKVTVIIIGANKNLAADFLGTLCSSHWRVEMDITQQPLEGRAHPHYTESRSTGGPPAEKALARETCVGVINRVQWSCTPLKCL